MGERTSARVGRVLGNVVATAVLIWLAWCVSVATRMPFTHLLIALVVVNGAMEAWGRKAEPADVGSASLIKE